MIAINAANSIISLSLSPELQNAGNFLAAFVISDAHLSASDYVTLGLIVLSNTLNPLFPHASFGIAPNQVEKSLDVPVAVQLN